MGIADTASAGRAEVREATMELVSGRADVASRFLETERGRVHVLEQGSGPPAVFIHGGGTAAVQWLPLLDALEQVRAVAVDRPAFGLSDPVEYRKATFRETAVGFVESVLDGLGLEQATLVGNSMGGAWSLWFALAHPERVDGLVLAGATPLLPGARIPAPLRVMAAPGVGAVLMKLMKPSRSSVVQMMGAFGEAETIVDYPEQIDVMVAAGRDPIAADAGRAETVAVLTPFGFRSQLELTADELAGLDVPVLLVWGSDDPVRGPDMADRLMAAFPEASLVDVAGAGHLPWLRDPEHVAGTIRDFASERH